jgi:hypothetical protein
MILRGVSDCIAHPRLGGAGPYPVVQTSTGLPWPFFWRTSGAT